MTGFKPKACSMARVTEGILNTKQKGEIKWLIAESCNGFWSRITIISRIIIGQDRIDYVETASENSLIGMNNNAVTSVEIWDLILFAFFKTCWVSRQKKQVCIEYMS